MYETSVWEPISVFFQSFSSNLWRCLFVKLGDRNVPVQNVLTLWLQVDCWIQFNYRIHVMHSKAIKAASSKPHSYSRQCSQFCPFLCKSLESNLEQNKHFYKNIKSFFEFFISVSKSFLITQHIVTFFLYSNDFLTKSNVFMGNFELN